MDPQEQSQLQSEMERLHGVSIGAVQELTQLMLHAADLAMTIRAQRAARVLAFERTRAGEEAARFKADREMAAVIWARTREDRWILTATPERIAETWASAQAWSRLDPRAYAAVDRLTDRLEQIGVDVTAAQTAVTARDVAALRALLDAPDQPTTPTGGDTPDPGRDPAATAPLGPRAAAAAQTTAKADGTPGITPEQLDQVADLVRSTQPVDVAAAILGDKEWLRVAGQLHRVLPKAAAAGVDLRQVLSTVAPALTRCTDTDTRTPAGWMIWTLHNATAARGVQLIAQAHDQPGVHLPRRGTVTRTGPGRPAPQRQQDRPAAER